MNAKDFAEQARAIAKPNMILIAAQIWMEGPASVEEWERDSIKMHEEQLRRSEEFHAREADREQKIGSLVRS